MPATLRWCPVALVLSGVLLAARPATAQTGGVAGMVVDQSGAALSGATVTLTAADLRRVGVSDAVGTYRFAALPSGTYQVAVELPGFARARVADIAVTAGEVTIPPIALAIAGFDDTVVITASRIESRVLDAPATMTVIPASALVVAPATTFGDLLRGVPGLNVIQTSARDINLTSRQATTTVATSQLALLDGRSIYLDFLGQILWDLLPTDVGDIKQIEVVRGPASAVWGAHALTGVVNIITKSPREIPSSTRVTLSAGWFDRHAGSTVGRGVGALYGASVSSSRVVNDRWAYRVSAGDQHADTYPRPIGSIPLIADPRDPHATVGGAAYPIDGDGALGTAFSNVGTSQPKADVRVDQELDNGRVTYAGGVAGTSGTVHTGVGPFSIQPGSVMAYGRISYARGALRISSFLNALNAKAPNLLLPDARTGKPLRLDFTTTTFDVEASDSRAIGVRHALNYGGNIRSNNADVTLAPAATTRHEGGAYLQDEVFLGRWQLVLGGRLDKFGSIDNPVFSPRLAVIFKPTPSHAVRASFNQASRPPSTINNYLDVALVTPVDLRAIGLQAPFPLVVHGVGSVLPIGSTQRPELRQESLTAYEVAYTGTLAGRTTAGVALYVNDVRNNINFVTLPPSLDPYTPANPPPGWPLPPQVLGALALNGVYLPRTAFTYLNLGPLRQKGVELSLEHRVNSAASGYVNYSWQDAPQVLEHAPPYPASELAFAPAHRINAGAMYNGARYLADVDAHYAGRAFWSDVLTPVYHGYSGAYTMVNGSAGIRWPWRRSVTTVVKVNNLFNRTIQQHVFGDLLRRSVIAELRFEVP